MIPKTASETEMMEGLLLQVQQLKNEWEVNRNTFPIPHFVEDKFQKIDDLLYEEYEFDDYSYHDLRSEMGKIKMALGDGERFDFEAMLLIAGSEDRLWYFYKNSHLLDDKEYWSNLRSAYQDHGDIRVMLFTVQSLFTSQRVKRKFLMNHYERRYLNELPNEIQIFRGMSIEEFNSKNFGISWTLRKEVAEKFKKRKRHGETEKVIHQITVDRDEVIAYFAGRKEFEIIYITPKFSKQ